MKFNFIGASYTSQSVNADCQTTLNLYPETIESQEGKNRMVLYTVPGKKPFCALDELPVRGQVLVAGRAFAVGGSIFSEQLANGTKTNYGNVANDGTPVSIAAGTNQIIIASAGSAYVFDLTANTLTPIPAGTLANVAQVGYCDGFFLALLKNSHTWQASALLDATTWPPLSIATINVFIDNILSILVDHREVWLFGLTKSCVYYDSGNSPFPFDLVPGGFIEQGISAANSPVRLDNSIFWLGGDERGNAVAWRARGYTPSRVSNHAVEFAWQGYATVADAVGYSYQDQGHAFWVLYFPTANKTWVYDVSTNMWHERGRWNAANGVYTADRSQNHIFAFGKHLVGDWASGKIYQMSISFYDDDGNPIRRVRRAPHISDEMDWSFHHQLQIDLETGLGPTPPLQGVGTPITITLRDSALALWTVNVNNNGTLNQTPGSANAFQTIVLNNSANTVSWQLGVTTLGILTTTSVAFNAANPQSFLMISLDGTKAFQLGVSTAGALLTAPDLATLARDPIVNLRFSDDGGHKWSNEYAMSAGQAGEFKKRVIWRRLGRSRDRVYELNCADAIPLRLIGEELEISGGASA
jgi:hypothetical protein